MAEVRHEPERNRFVITEGGAEVGVADYRDSGGVRAFTHTHIDPACRGRGLAAELVRFALAQTRESGLTAQPLCWYVADYVRAHPESVRS